GRRIIGGKLLRPVRPAERGERPERGGEPGIEHVLVAREDLARREVFELLFDPRLPRTLMREIVLDGRLERRLFVLFDEDLAVRTVPGGYLVSPPELARNAPRLDVLHPLEVGLFPVLRDEGGAPFPDAFDRRFGERLRVHIPL